LIASLFLEMNLAIVPVVLAVAVVLVILFVYATRLAPKDRRLDPKRAAAFVFGCIVARLLIVLFVHQFRGTRLLQMLSVLALLPAAGFFYLYVTGKRTTGPEVFGGKIWWNDIRPIHGAFWLAFAAMAAVRWPHAYAPLVMDVLVGTAAWLLRLV